jgi:hypothetical protein
MPEGVGYGPQFTASVGKKLNYIGEHCYATSGEVNTAGQGVNVALLDYTSGNGYIVATVQFGIHSESNNNIAFSVKFNGKIVIGYALSGATSDAQSSNYWPILIPPYTHVECIGNNLESGSAIPLTCVVTGRVYGLK